MSVRAIPCDASTGRTSTLIVGTASRSTFAAGACRGATNLWFRAIMATAISFRTAGASTVHTCTGRRTSWRRLSPAGGQLEDFHFFRQKVSVKECQSQSSLPRFSYDDLVPFKISTYDTRSQRHIGRCTREEADGRKRLMAVCEKVFFSLTGLYIHHSPPQAITI